MDRTIFSKKNNKRFDTIIVGAGFSGLIQAIALAEHGCKVAIIDKKTFEKIANPDFDGRAFAIAYGSRLFFEKINVWQNLENQATPIKEIRVSDQDSKFFLHFDGEQSDKTDFGYMIEAEFLIKTLFNKIKDYKNISLFTDISYKEIKNDDYSVTITLDNRQEIIADFLIVAEGKNSQARKLLGIKSLNYDYKFDAIVCKIKHELPHHNIAQERFLATGPFAVLPLKDRHYSSIVWIEKPNLAAAYTSMQPDELAQYLELRIGEYLGKISIASQVTTYPLKLVYAQEYCAKRSALIADSAHSIHPLAGQGLNLGIRDIELLTNLLVARKELGLDLGSNELLKNYRQERQFDTTSMILATTLLNSLFLADNLFVKTLRRLGLGAVNSSGKIKALCVKHAMGV